MVGNMPIQKWRSGGIEAALWKNERQVNGATVEFRTVSLSRSYRKKGEDIWRSDVIGNLRVNDIQKVLLVLQKAQESLLLRTE